MNQIFMRTDGGTNNNIELATINFFVPRDVAILRKLRMNPCNNFFELFPIIVAHFWSSFCV